MVVQSRFLLGWSRDSSPRTKPGISSVTSAQPSGAPRSLRPVLLSKMRLDHALDLHQPQSPCVGDRTGSATREKCRNPAPSPWAFFGPGQLRRLPGWPIGATGDFELVHRVDIWQARRVFRRQMTASCSALWAASGPDRRHRRWRRCRARWSCVSRRMTECQPRSVFDAECFESRFSMLALARRQPRSTRSAVIFLDLGRLFSSTWAGDRVSALVDLGDLGFEQESSCRCLSNCFFGEGGNFRVLDRHHGFITRPRSHSTPWCDKNEGELDAMAPESPPSSDFPGHFSQASSPRK